MAQQDKLIQRIWPGFSKSAAYAQLRQAGQPAAYLRHTAELVNDMMDAAVGADPKQWQTDDISGMLLDFLEMAAADDDDDAQAIFEDTYALMKALLSYLADQGEIGASPQALALLFTRFEREIDAAFGAGQAPGFIDWADDPEVAGLPQWQENRALSLQEEFGEWFNGFVKLKGTAELVKHLGEVGLARALQNFVERAYDGYRKTPRSWSKHVIDAVYHDAQYHQVSGLSSAQWPWLGKALVAFIDYGSKHGFVTKRYAAQVIPWLKSGCQQLIATGLPESSPLAAALQAVIEAAVANGELDPHDPDAIAAFEATLQDKLADFGMLDSKVLMIPELPHDPDELAALVKDVGLVAELVDAFDTDSDFLDQHQKVVDGRRWDRDAAVANHDQALEVGVKLWLLQRDYPVPKAAEIADIVSTVTAFADVMYAQHITTIGAWSPQAFASYRRWLLGREDRETLALFVEIIRRTIALLYDEATFSKDRARKLQLAIGATPTVDGQGTGQVISLDQGKRRLAKKQRR